MKAAAAFLVLALAACANVAPPNDELGAARAMIVQAEPLASRYAPNELRAAQAKLSAAERSMARSDWRQARRLAEEAQVDAKLAWALAENERSRRALAEGSR